MVCKLCIRSLRRGFGSVDFIHGLLIMKDDLDEEENESEVTPILGTSTVSGSDTGTPDPALPNNDFLGARFLGESVGLVK